MMIDIGKYPFLKKQHRSKTQLCFNLVSYKVDQTCDHSLELKGFFFFLLNMTAK